MNDRRGFLRTGMAGVLGLSLPEWLAVQAQATRRTARAKNVLVILEQGGLSHIDTWDPKPDVVSEHRSPHRPIATSVPGIQFTSLLTRTARLAHKLAVVRSMHHAKNPANGHPDGTQYALSGSNPRSPLEMPDIGSVVSTVMGSSCPFLPPYIMVPGNNEQNASTRNGFLPASTRVFKTGGNDVSDPNWRVNNLLPRPENAGDRFDHRQTLLTRVDADYLRGGRFVGGMERFY